MEIQKKKWWRPIHTKWLLGIVSLILVSNGVYKKYFMDEFTLDTVRITNINNGTLTNGDTTIPTSQSVYNAIEDATFNPASGQKGWIDITDPAYGGVANGGFNTGTDNTPAINAALGVSVNNSVIYIPPGSYRFLSQVNWPTNKRVFLVCYGDLYFGTSNGFVISGEGRYHVLWFNGAIYGTNQFGTPNYTGLTNAGIDMRNSRNNTVHANFIHGFKDAIRVTGVSGGGGQYNKISFIWLNRNSVGIKLNVEGTGAWSNESIYVGGEISCDTGVVFSPGSTVYDGNKFYNIGFEYAGGSTPMRVGIRASNASQNHWYGGRIEPAGVTTKFLCDLNTVSGMSFHGWYMQDEWLHDVGQSVYVSGIIYSNGGIQIGTQAMGYASTPDNPYQAGRVKVRGLSRSPSAANELNSNIDIQWDVLTDAVSSASSYTFLKGINFVEMNYAGGTATVNLPTANTRSNEYITVKNMHATNSVTVVGALAGSLTSIPGYGAITYYSDGNQWVDVSTRIVYGGGGSSQWTTIGNNIFYTTGSVGIGINQTATSYAHLHLGASTSTVAAIEFAAGTSVSSPRNGAFWFDGTDWRVAAQSVPQKILTDYNSATLVNKSWQGLDFGLGYIATTGGSQGHIPVVNSGTAELVYRFSQGGTVEVTGTTYTVHDTVQYIKCNRASGTIAITMPNAAACYGRELNFRNMNVANVTFTGGDPSSSQNIATGQGGCVVWSDGTNWRIKSKWHD